MTYVGSPRRVKLAALAASVSLIGFVGCTSSDDLSLPDISSSGAASDVELSWCVYLSTGQCFQGYFSECPGEGGFLAYVCPYSSSSNVGVNVGSSSSGTGIDNNSSSSDVLQEYAWCVFAGDQTCLPGPISVCPPGGTLGNACPYSSSSISSGRSSSGGGGLSSGSGVDISFMFTDPRDGKKYKYELGPDGRVWMSENLNFSDGNTLGWCYEDGVKTLGEPGADGEGCNSPYGRTYNQITAMDVCPPDWHLPSGDEWDSIGFRMSKDFYVLAGNYDDRNGWKERVEIGANFSSNGFYWTSQPTIFRVMGKDFISTPMDNASATNDYFSVRCIMDATAGNTGNCNGVPFNPLIQLCLEGMVYSVFVIEEQILIGFDSTSTYDWATAMNLPLTCNNENISCASEINIPHQGICPEGWHLPKRNEVSFSSQAVLRWGGELKFWAVDEYYYEDIVRGAYIISVVGTWEQAKTSLNLVRCVKN